MIHLSYSHKIIDARAIFDDKEIKLEEKPEGNSGQVRCHFYTRKFGDFKITLRLDWDDLDKDGNPTLDADISKSGKKYHIGRDRWHHSQKTSENGEYVYIWKPEIDELKNFLIEVQFKLQTTNQQQITGKSLIIEANKN